MKLRKVISALLALAVVLGIIPISTLAADVDGGLDVYNTGGSLRGPIIISNNYETICEGEVKSAVIENGGDHQYFSFTPDRDGCYAFYSISQEDNTCGSILNENMEELRFNDDERDGNLNFKVKYQMTAETTYILDAWYRADYQTGTFDVTVVETTFITDLEIVSLPDNLDYIRGLVARDLQFSGLILKATWSDDSVVFWNADFDGDCIGDEMLHLNIETVEDDGIVKIFCGDEQVQFTVNLLDNPVESIELLTELPEITCIENANGNWRERWNDETQQNEQFFEYDLWDLGLPEIQIQINYTDGTHRTASIYEEVDGHRIELENRQYDKIWTTGDDNYFIISYLGKEIPIQVTVIPNPVESIELLTELPEITCIENTNGNWCERWNNETQQDEQYFDYDLWDLRLPEIEIQINYTDGTHKTATLYSMVDGYTIEARSRQYEKIWTLGSDNYFSISYFGKEIPVQVTVIPNPVESIELLTELPEITCIENTNGNWRERWNDETQQNEQFFEYDLWDLRLPAIEIQINYTDGTHKTATLYSMVDGYTIEARSRQYEKIWTLGSDNYFSISYFGKEIPVQVTVISNPVESIELLTELPEITCIENTNGNWSSRWNDETQQNEPYFDYDLWDLRLPEIEIQINYTDGTHKTATLYSMVDGYSVETKSRQYDKAWTLGSDNYFSISYFGKEIPVQVTVISNPVESIELLTELPEITCVENTNGNWNSRWNGETQQDEQYFDYDLWDLRLPEIEIQINYADGTHKTASINEEVDGYRIELENRQYEKIWTIGDDNYFNISYLGKKIPVQVTVISNPLDYIEIDSAPTREYFYGDSLYGCVYEDGGYEFYPNDITGLVFTAYYIDGTKKQYTSSDAFDRQDFDGYRYSLNFDANNPQIGDFPVTFEYMGKTAEYTVVLKESPVTSVMVAKLPDKTVYPDYCLPDLNGLEIRVDYQNGDYDTIVIGVDNSQYVIDPGGNFALEFTLNGNTGYIEIFRDENSVANIVNILYMGKMCAIDGLSFTHDKEITDVSFKKLNPNGTDTQVELTYDDGTSSTVNLDKAIRGAGLCVLFTVTDEGLVGCAVFENENDYGVVIFDRQLFVEKQQKLIGDVDGNGSITAKDVTILRRYLAGGWDVTINEANSDINGEDGITAKDVTLLRRYLAGGWGVELG